VQSNARKQSTLKAVNAFRLAHPGMYCLGNSTCCYLSDSLRGACGPPCGMTRTWPVSLAPGAGLPSLWHMRSLASGFSLLSRSPAPVVFVVVRVVFPPATLQPCQVELGGPNIQPWVWGLSALIGPTHVLVGRLLWSPLPRLARRGWVSPITTTGGGGPWLLLSPSGMRGQHSHLGTKCHCQSLYYHEQSKLLNAVFQRHAGFAGPDRLLLEFSDCCSCRLPCRVRHLCYQVRVPAPGHG
jgi:hypothetical protein